MNAIEREKLSKEAKMQMNALKKINMWKTAAIALSTIGVAISYASIAGTNCNLFLGILGIILIIINVGSAIVLNLGLRNGRKNVEKILDILEEKRYEV